MAIIIQAGHVGIESNCDWGLRGETGAPHERDFTSAIAAAVCGGLQAHGLVAIAADANANCDGQITSRDYEAVIALHCDARFTSGFAVGVGNPTQDGAAAASEHLAEALRTAYAAATGLPDVNDLLDNPNVTEYYLFNSLTQATPFALIEMGAISAPDGSFGSDFQWLQDHKADVASGIVDGVVAFLSADPTTAVAPVETQNEAPAPAQEVPPKPVLDGNGFPTLVGPPPATIPPETSNKDAILTNLGQAIKYIDQIFAADTPKSDAPTLIADRPTLIAISNEVHAARHLLGGE